MTVTTPRFLANVEELRRNFDESFAAPAHAPEENVENFLAIRVAARPLALRIGDLGRIEEVRKIVALPAANSDFLGLAGIQGRLLAVYSLSMLLTLGPTEGRWLAVCGVTEPIALMFDTLDGFLRAPLGDVLEVATEGPENFLKQVVRGTEVRHVVDVPSILTAIRKRLGNRPGAAKE